MIRQACAAILLLATGGARDVRAQPSPPQPQATISVDVSASDIVRRSALFTAGGQALNAAADAGLDAGIGRQETRKTGDILIRLARLWFVNLPIAALTEGAVHDAGHFARDAELTGILRGRRIKQWPWPVPISVSVEYGSSAEAVSPVDDALGLPVLGGGEQAATLTKQRLADEIYRRDAAGYFDWVLFAYASLDYPVYAWTDFTGTLGASGDFQQYVTVMTELSPPPPLPFGPGAYAFVLQELPAFHRFKQQLQRDAWLNLLDLSLWEAFEHVARYVVTGERAGNNGTLRIHGVRLVPAAYATLSSQGPEEGAVVRVISPSLLTRVGIRRITTPSNQSLWGSGIAIRSRDTSRFLPEVNFDLWQRAGKSPGVRVEAGTAHALTFAGRSWDASVRLGYKTEGYALDAPQRATLLATLGLTARF